MKKIRIIDIANSRIPNIIFKYNLFESIFSRADVKDVFRFSDATKVGSSVGLDDKNDIFIKRYYDQLKNPASRIESLVIDFLSFIFSIFFVIRSIIMFFFLRKSDYVFVIFDKVKVFKCEVGDCFLSDYLRSHRSSGYMKISALFFLKMFLFYYRIYSFGFKVNNIEKYKYDGDYFFCNETTYIAEAKRRVLIRYGYKEIRFESLSGKIEILPPLYGYEIRNRKDKIETIYESFTWNDLEKARNKIKNLVFRDETYRYMLNGDVDKDCKINFVDSYLPKEKTVVIYMHAVSDAQFIYGKDCFIDLHDWLVKVIEIASRLNIPVCVKLHPSFYNEDHNYISDRKYLKYLSELFEVDLFSVNKNDVVKTNKHDLAFIGYAVPITKVSEEFDDFLCVTHHGSVACEAAYLGHKVIVSNSSPYNQNDKFVNGYSSLGELEELMRKYFEGGLPEINEESLLKYIFMNHFYRKFYYFINYFPRLPNVVNSSIRSMNNLEFFLLNQRIDVDMLDRDMQAKIVSNLSKGLK